MTLYPYSEKIPITTNWEIMQGQPCLEGTRLTIDFLRSQVATGASLENIAFWYDLDIGQLESIENYLLPF